jgi:hypothetical protein
MWRIKTGQNGVREDNFWTFLGGRLIKAFVF